VEHPEFHDRLLSTLVGERRDDPARQVEVSGEVAGEHPAGRDYGSQLSQLTLQALSVAGAPGARRTRPPAPIKRQEARAFNGATASLS
jgi:hypothetical protein